MYDGIPCPCKGCTERQIGCHGNCEGYINYQKQREELKREAKRVAVPPVIRKGDWTGDSGLKVVKHGYGRKKRR